MMNFVSHALHVLICVFCIFYPSIPCIARPLSSVLHMVVYATISSVVYIEERLQIKTVISNSL